MNVKNVVWSGVKYGLTFSAGALGGMIVGHAAGVESAELDEDTATDVDKADVWQGQDMYIGVTNDEVDELLCIIDEALEESRLKHLLFAEDDLNDIKRELLHSDKGPGEAIIRLPERKVFRLLLLTNEEIRVYSHTKEDV